ncbi:hypothetical protein [Solicola gregarius]|uniref:Uncharacterized protein n=1 Tax=Solicola gregarius TaxID=2908642 RepID=A0AA46TFT1_9ACTN|nr:hypothetical protein [Solicola gregarius]UYM04311.1 hypothetical protein L0C25_17455 [Solicola gregarius]
MTHVACGAYVPAADPAEVRLPANRSALIGGKPYLGELYGDVRGPE